MFLRTYTRPSSNLDLFSVLSEATKALQERVSLRADVKETADNFLVYFDLPGLKKENIDIKIKNGSLTVATKEEEVTEKETKENEKFLLKERASKYVQQERTLNFGDSVSGEVSAKFENGVLEIVLKKTNPDTEEKSISIQ